MRKTVFMVYQATRTMRGDYMLNVHPTIVCDTLEAAWAAACRQQGYFHPNVVRMEIYTADPARGGERLVCLAVSA